MKKQVALTVLSAHLCLSLFLSFDWDFLEGDYLGFGITFLIIYSLSVPIVISALAIIDSLIALIKKKRVPIDYVIVVTGVLVLTAYLLSASGSLSGTPLTGIAYAILPIGTLALVGCEIGKLVHKRLLKNKNVKK